MHSVSQSAGNSAVHADLTEEEVERLHYLLGAIRASLMLGGFKSEAQQGVDEWKLRIRKRLQAYVRRPRMANEMHG
jgi:hypothetical protein